MNNTCDRCKKEGLGYVNSIYVGNRVLCKSCYSVLKDNGELEKIRKESEPKYN